MSGSPPAVVHVVDDDPSLRDALARLLRAAGYAVTSYDSADAFLKELPSRPPGCVITDVRMPERSGLDLLRDLQHRLDDFPVVMLTGHAEVAMAVEALKAGASDFIEKPFDAAAMLDLVQTLTARVNQRAETQDRQSDYARRMAALSAREREVLRGLIAGLPNKIIARDLGISPRTVETYRANLMLKTHASSFSELVRMALLSEGAARS